MGLFCGLDCGGTKTLCVIADESGKVIGSGKGGPSNYLSCSEKLSKISIRESIDKAFYSAGIKPCRLTCAYVASAAIEVNCGSSHIPFLTQCIDAEYIYANSDAIPVWFAAVGKEPAIVAISGTGSVAYAFFEDSFLKAGGWGPFIGDEGSGYKIGQEIINSATRAQDGRLEDEQTLRTILNHFSLSDLNDIHRILKNGDTRSLIASAARCTCDLYNKGNKSAITILEKAAKELALAIKTVAGKAAFNKPVPLILSGSLLQLDQPLYRLLQKYFTNTECICCILSPQIPAAVSAASLALYESGRKTEAESLLKKYEVAER